MKTGDVVKKVDILISVIGMTVLFASASPALGAQDATTSNDDKDCTTQTQIDQSGIESQEAALQESQTQLDTAQRQLKAAEANLRRVRNSAPPPGRTAPRSKLKRNLQGNVHQAQVDSARAQVKAAQSRVEAAAAKVVAESSKLDAMLASEAQDGELDDTGPCKSNDEERRDPDEEDKEA